MLPAPNCVDFSHSPSRSIFHSHSLTLSLYVVYIPFYLLIFCSMQTLREMFLYIYKTQFFDKWSMIFIIGHMRLLFCRKILDYFRYFDQITTLTYFCPCLRSYLTIMNLFYFSFFRGVSSLGEIVYFCLWYKKKSHGGGGHKEQTPKIILALPKICPWWNKSWTRLCHF